MGYFSNLMIEWEEHFPDHSYTPPEKVLEWRIDDLLDRKAELESEDNAKGCHLYGDDLRFCLPNCFSSVDDIESAIEIAQEELVALRGYEYDYEVEISLDKFIEYLATIKPKAESVVVLAQRELLAA